MENSSQEEEFKRGVMKYWRVDFDKQMRLMRNSYFAQLSSPDSSLVWKWNPPTVRLRSLSVWDSESTARMKKRRNF